MFFSNQPFFKGHPEGFWRSHFFQYIWLGVDLPSIFNPKKLGHNSGGHNQNSKQMTQSSKHSNKNWWRIVSTALCKTNETHLLTYLLGRDMLVFHKNLKIVVGDSF